MTILTVINQKGGVGKTTTAEMIGSELIHRGHSVLFIDMDAQANLSYTLQADGSGLGGNSSYELLTGDITADEAIQITERGHVIGSSPALNGADITITQTGKEYRLKEALQPVEDRYDYIIIDTPPKLGIVTSNALTASAEALIPAQADIYSLQGINQLNETIQVIRKYTNPELNITGIVLTRFNPRTILSQEVAEMLEETAVELDTKLFETRIRESIAVKEAQAMQIDIFSHDPKNNVSIDYRALVDEIIKEEE